MQPAIRLRVAHLRGAPLGTKRPYIRTIYHRVDIIESVDSISRDERDVPLTQYITNA